jgi:hypothetical protein
MRRILTFVTFMALFLSTTVIAQSAEWQPVTGEENLRSFMSDTKMEWEEPGGENSRGEYRADGSGTLYSWGGAAIPRTWEVKGDDQICVGGRQETQCWKLEKNSADPTLYRSTEVKTGTVTEFRRSKDGTTVTKKGDPEAAGNKGGPAAASADEMAAQLADPNSPVASLTFKNKFTRFEGDLPDADNQSMYTLVFQPTLPFILGSGSKVIWRPSIPLLVGKPVFDSSTASFDGESGLGDIGFDLIYVPKLKRKDILFGYGIITTLPTGTDSSLTTGQWTLGPEMIIGKLDPKYTLAFFPKHQWDVAGWGDTAINVTALQPIFTYLPGGGWNIGTAPNITYNWENEQWTVPLHLTVGKTVMISGRPWKFAAELDYFVENSDTFAPEWMVSFNITPVVENKLAR